MRNIRIGVFETNSSSSHSISIHYPSGNRGTEFEPNLLETELKELASDDSGAIIFTPNPHDPFGWGPEKYRDATTKAQYILTGLKQLAQKDGFEQNQDTKNFYEDGIKILIEVLEEQTGRKVLIQPLDDDSDPWGHIDHESEYVFMEALTSAENLKQFIFDPSSVLDIDNNNH